ncbi:hypothetical protein RFI_17264, partial [Reticulomyxa filosa]
RKHVLCERPIGSPKDVEVIIASCRVKNVQFMDGIQFMHHSRFKDLNDKIHQKKILGDILRINSTFSVPWFVFFFVYVFFFFFKHLPIPPPLFECFVFDYCGCTTSLDVMNIRNIPELEPLGVLGDLGSHSIRLSLWAFDYEQPLYVKAVCHKRSKDGAIQDVSCWIFFSGDRIASFDCSYHSPLRQNAEIVGEKGTAEIRQWSLPSEKQCFYTVQYSTLNPYDCSEYIKSAKFTNCTQEVEMIHRMSRIHQTQKAEGIWPLLTLMTEKVLDACRRSIDRSGELVEFVKGQIPVDMGQSSKNRRSSVVESMKVFEPLADISEQYQLLVNQIDHEKKTETPQ